MSHQTIPVMGVVAASFFFFHQAWGFDFSRDGKGENPIAIDAEKGIHCDQETHRCTAKGNVHITQKKAHLRADEVVAYLDQASEGVQSLSKVEAKGHVVLTTDDKPYHLKATHGTYDIQKETMVFYGTPVRLDLEKGWVQAHGSMSFNTKTLVATAKGQAKAFKDGNHVSAPILKAQFERTPQGALVIKSVEADQDVTYHGSTRMVIAGKVRHQPKTGITHAQDQVTVVDEKGILQGAEGHVDNKNDITTMTGADPSVEGSSNPVEQRVRGLLIPKSK